jgi:predicted AlkP superfamily pyrophosphatase or phosphodiesterase
LQAKRIAATVLGVLVVEVCMAALLGAAVFAQQKKGSGPLARGPIRHVILISVDGLMPASYLRPEEHGLKVPTLREMARAGAVADGVESVFPTYTYPAHTSMVTGVRPATHGIVTNRAWDPLERNDDGWRWYAEDIRAPTLWEVARERGMRTGLIAWPVTVGVRATHVVPEVWRAGTAEDHKLVRALSTPGLLDAVQIRAPDFWQRYTPPTVMDTAATDIATYLVETYKPQLLLLHLVEVDNRQHNKGLFTAESKAAIENADAQIARVIAAAKRAGIWQGTALVVVSDHGFAQVTQRIRPGVILREKGLITLDDRNRPTEWKACVLAGAAHAYLYVKDAQDRATRQTLVETFTKLAGIPGSGIGRVYSQEEIHALGGDPEAFLALEAGEGFTMAGGYAGELLSASRPTVATHGYDPRRADMQGALVVYGPPIAAGRIRGARLVDVAPTIAGWLGLKLPKAEGKPLTITPPR